MKFCIVGTGRCGTRLLREMMDSHPDVFVFNETHWIPKLYEFFGTSVVGIEDLLDVVHRTSHVNGVPTTEFDHHMFLESIGHPRRMSVAEFCDALGTHFAEQDGKSLWADKTPDYGYFVSLLQVYWPNCRIIHLIRDGAAVVQSMSRHPGYRALVALRQQSWAPISLDYAGKPDRFPEQPMRAFAELWYSRLVRTMDEAQRLKQDTYLEVRHEEILSSPADELRKIALFIGLSADKRWLDNAHTLIDTEKAGKPRPVEVLEHFTDRHRKLLKDLGYSAEPG